jgi:hypothetical protein
MNPLLLKKQGIFYFWATPILVHENAKKTVIHHTINMVFGLYERE